MAPTLTWWTIRQICLLLIVSTLPLTVWSQADCEIRTEAGAARFGPVCPFDCTCGRGSCSDTATCTGYCAAPAQNSKCVFGDISRGKTAVQISNYVDIASANLAMSGNYSSNDHVYCTHTDIETKLTQPWWRIDFGSEHVVYGLYVYNRITGTKELNRLSYFQVRVGNNGQNVTVGQLFNANPVCKNYDDFVAEILSTSIKPLAWVECQVPLRGRYLSIQNKEAAVINRGPDYKHILTFCEVDIRGYKVCDDANRSGKKCDVTGCWCWNNVCGAQNILGYCTNGCMIGRIGKICMEEILLPTPTMEHVNATAVNVTWKAPIPEGAHADSYNSVTVSYTVQYRRLGETGWKDNTGVITTSDNTRTATISDLTASEVYEIRVRMIKHGYAQPRDAALSATAITCAVPKAMNVTATTVCRKESGVEEMHMNISWQGDDTLRCLSSPPAYDVEYAALGSNFVTQQSVTSPYKTNSVSDNTTYLVRVKGRYSNQQQLSNFYSYSENITVKVGAVPAPENLSLVSSSDGSHNKFTVKATWKQPTTLCPLIDNITNYVRYRQIGTRRDVVFLVQGQLEYTITNLNMSNDYQIRVEAHSAGRAKGFTGWIKPDKPIIKEPEPLPVGAIVGGVVAAVICVALIGLALGLFYYYRIKSTKPKNTERYPKVEQPALNDMNHDNGPQLEMEPVHYDNRAFAGDVTEPELAATGTSSPITDPDSPPIIACPPPRDSRINPKKEMEEVEDYSLYLED